MHLKIFGIDIERKTDILAFAAFIISIGSLLSQVINLVKRPDVELYPLKQILFTPEVYDSETGEKYIWISSKLVYINNGSPNYHDIVTSETLSFPMNNINVELTAQHFIKSWSEKGKLKTDIISDANPVQIKSGGVLVHETLFVPWPSEPPNNRKNFVKMKDFLDYLEKNDELTIKISVSTYSGYSSTETCNLIVSEFLKDIKKKGWSTPICH